MLLPLPQAWTFLMTLRLLLLALLSRLSRSSRDLGCADVARSLGAAGWAFSDFLVFFLGWPHSAAAPRCRSCSWSRTPDRPREPGRRSVGVLVAAILAQ